MQKMERFILLISLYDDLVSPQFEKKSRVKVCFDGQKTICLTHLNFQLYIPLKIEKIKTNYDMT